MFIIRNPKVIAAVIDCYNLPISKKCELLVAEREGLTFIADEYERPTISRATIKDLSLDFEVTYWGAIITTHRRGDIYNYVIDPTTGESKYHCYYNKEGKIKYGRYYEPSID